MQILTISDEVVPAIYSLNLGQRFPDVGLVLGCGDLPYYYLEFVVTMLNAACFYVPGNHDMPELTSDGQTIATPRGAVNIDGKSVQHNGLLIAGLGGSIRYKPAARNQYSQRQMVLRVWRLVPQFLFNFARYGRYVDIFLAHAPPLGIHNGPDYPHTGFSVFLWLMERFRPRYFVHGHIHLSYGFGRETETIYRNTRVLNTAGYRLLEID